MTFRETHLISERGLWTLYSEMQKLPVTRRYAAKNAAADAAAIAEGVPMRPGGGPGSMGGHGGDVVPSGTEAADMAAVMRAYAQWAHLLFPRIHHGDVLAKAALWSGKGVVKKTLQQMRVELEIPRARGEGGAGSEQEARRRYLEAAEAAQKQVR